MAGIKITSLPTKLTYEQGELQDNTGLEVVEVTDDGSEQVISDYTVSSINYGAGGTQEIIVSKGDYEASYTVTCNFPNQLASLIGYTGNMEVIQNTIVNDMVWDKLTGVDWFKIADEYAETITVTGFHWVLIGSDANYITLFDGDGVVDTVRRLEAVLDNGHKFLKIRVEGYSSSGNRTESYALVYELYFFDDNTMFLNIIDVPEENPDDNISEFGCGYTPTELSVELGTPTVFSFYPKDEDGWKWTVENMPHEYLLTGISVSKLPDKVEYRSGEQLDCTGMVVTVHSAMGDYELASGYTVSGYDSEAGGTQTVTVAYRGYEAGFEVSVDSGITVRFIVRHPETAELTVLKTETLQPGQSAVPPEAPFILGYVFNGWSVSYDNLTEDTAVYTVYLPRNICTVIFADHDGTMLKKQYVACGKVASPPANPRREGYVFSGWDTDYSTVMDDITVKALYEACTDVFTVTFLDASGNVLKEEAVAYGGSAVAPEPPAMEGCFFLGWSMAYGYVTENISTQALYRSTGLKTAVDFYDGNTRAGRLNMAIECEIEQKLNGECSMELTTLAGYAAFVDRSFTMEVDGLIFSITGMEKKTQSGTYLISLQGEHVSYALNDYTVEEFYFTGTPAGCLAKILQGTPFSTGTVDFTDDVTLMVNQQATRRDVLMQLVALCGGEVEYDKYTIGIRRHIGSTAMTELMYTKNVTNVGMSYSSTDGTEVYTVELARRVDLDLGDEIHIVFQPLGIDTVKRITGLAWNPFNFRQVSISVGGYRASLSDSLYQLVEESRTLEEKVNAISENVQTVSDALDSLGESLSVGQEGSGGSSGGGYGGFNVLSVEELPEVTDENTIYLVQGIVEVT